MKDNIANDSGSPVICRVCRTDRVDPFQTVGGILYWRCPECRATCADASMLPDRRTEQEQYRLHNNDPKDPAYRTFLNRLAIPLLERLSPGSEGLDYGCGPGPALAAMLSESGHNVRLYDPFFEPDASALQCTYDFVSCTETVEHFHDPAAEFDTLNRLLRPGGWLGIMTTFQTEDSQFADWHYRRDPTHVTFYREETFRYLAGQVGWYCEIPARNIVLMRKPFDRAEH